MLHSSRWVGGASNSQVVAEMTKKQRTLMMPAPQCVTTPAISMEYHRAPCSMLVCHITTASIGHQLSSGVDAGPNVCLT